MSVLSIRDKSALQREIRKCVADRQGQKEKKHSLHALWIAREEGDDGEIRHLDYVGEVLSQ